MLKSDRWIRKMSQEHDMIIPFSRKQVRDGMISDSYERRAADEFEIFTNVNSSTVDPKNFDEKFFVPCRLTSASFRPIRSCWRVRWSISRFHVAC
jgi:dCTP deaminase